MELSNVKEINQVVIYITNGVIGGSIGRKELLEKFLDLVEWDENTVRVEFPRWGKLAFPTQVTCGVSDDLNEERTGKLQRQGVLIVKSGWIRNCILERKLLLPIAEDRFKLVYTMNTDPCTLPMVHVKSSHHLLFHYSSKTEWSKHQDDVVRLIHRARLCGDFEKAARFESFILERGRTRQHIEDREKSLFGFAASVFD